MPAPRFKLTAPIPYEVEIQKSILQYLTYHPMVAWAARFNSGSARLPAGGGKFRPVEFNTCDGCSDILGQLKDGRILAIEVKRPPWTKPTDKHEVAQEDFLKKVRVNNGVGFFATSIKQVTFCLDLARR